MATIQVRGGESLQAAINAAVAGDTIEVESNATFNGPFTLPNKAGSSYITIQPSGLSNLPVDTRVAPAQAVFMYKLRATGVAPVLSTAPSAHHWRIIGADIATATSSDVYDILLLGDSSYTSLSQVPSNLEFDRCYVHGQPTQNAQRGIALNSASTTIKNSYISDIHVVGIEAQAIAGWNGPGPYSIVNNYIEGACQNILFGGADSSIPNLVPTDIEIRRNYLFKPLSWKVGHPSYAGFHWTVKNLLELKNAKNVVIDGNVLENCWLDAQTGVGVLFTVRNQSDTAPWSTVQNVTYTNNWVKNSAGGLNFLGQDNEGQPGVRGTGALVQNNLFTGIGPEPWMLINGFYDVTVNHNTNFQTGTLLLFNNEDSTGFVYTNNMTQYHDYGIVGFDINNASIFGTPVLAENAPGNIYTNNVIVGAAASGFTFSTAGSNSYPVDLATVQFVDFSGGNYSLQTGSPYHNAGSDGADIGYNKATLEAALAGTTPPVAAAPVVSTVSPLSGTTLGGTRLTLTGTGFQLGASVAVGGVAATNVVVNSSISIAATTAAHAAGTVNVVVTNPDSQSGTKSNGFTYVTPLSSPLISSVTPNSGTTLGGTSVSIAGSGFVSGATVTMGGIAVTNVTIPSSSSIIGLTPPHAAGSVAVVVSNPDGQTSTLSSGFLYVEPAPPPPPPAVTRTLTVASSTPSTGVLVTISPVDNNGLSNGTTSFARTYNDQTVVTLIAPSLAGVNTFVKWQRNGIDWSTNTTTNVVMNTNYTLTAIYQAPAPPPPPAEVFTLTVTTARPNSGVPITVSPLDNNQQGNGSSVFSRTYNSGTGVTLTAPQTAEGNVFKRWLRDGNVFSTLPTVVVTMDVNREMQAVYEEVATPPPSNPAPTIAVISPAKGSLLGGLSVSITGTGFQTGATVSFGGVAATGVAILSSTSLRCINPARAVAGSVNVIVTNPDSKSATKIGGFQYQKMKLPRGSIGVNPNGGLVVL